MPRYMVMVKGDPAADEAPTEEMFLEMGRYNEELANAGVMQSGEGLVRSAEGRRIRFGADRATTVVDGPFSETKELVAGFWIFECASLEEAVDWARKAPFPDGQELEVRKVAGPEDFGDAYSEDVAEQEDRIRSKLETHEAAEHVGS